MTDRVEGDGFVVRTTSSHDVPLLVAWHADPEIHRFWERRPLTEAEVAADYVDGATPGLRCFVIEAPPGKPVGFIQYAELDEPGAVGIDMFLVPAARGRGLGPRVARHLTQQLLDRGVAKRVTVDPLISNEGAVRAWGRAGFREEARIESGDHGGPAVLMVYDGDVTGP
ncbi:MAG: acetyltransferase [Actinomycetota bacterium]|nr:acetyltransferase [Actinomycetota bacterium]